MTVKRVGIMTGGGDCPGLNPVIRAAVRVGLRHHGWEMLGVEDATNGLIDLNYRSPHGNRWLTLDDVRDILTRGGTIIGTSNRSDPFNYVTVQDGKKVKVDVSDLVMENYHKMGLDAMISIGGDGSMAIAQKFIDKGMNIVGVPKTIDNDLGATDYTFGFDTAVQIATDAIDRIRDTAESHDRVMFVEVMGRDAGWIALHAGIAGGAHGILLPEIPYRIGPLIEKIKKRQSSGQPYSVVVVAEGAKPLDGEPSLLPPELGGMPRLMGAANRVAAEIQAADEDLDVRVTVLGHIQRGGTPSNFDRILGTRFGAAAADLVARGEFGRMVALRGNEIVSVPISEALGKSKRVDPRGQLVQTARRIGTVFGDERDGEVLV
jgi:phosphofructokinase-like protein